MARTLRRFCADRTGAVAMLSALCLMALVGSAALAVDLGHVFLRSRQLQGIADLAALSAVQALGSTTGATPASAAAATAAANGWPGGVQAFAATGSYAADTTVPAAQRFQAGASAPNAVQVTLRAPVPLFFAGLITGHPTLQLARTAVAAQAQYAAFSIGSSLAAVDRGVANAVLSGLTGSQVSLTVMDYQALASAKVDLLAFAPALRTRANLAGQSFGQTLSTAIAPSTALAALADALAASGQSAAATTARTLSASALPLSPSPLGTVLDLGPYAAQDHGVDLPGSQIQVDALDLVQAILGTANGGRQLHLTLDANAAGLAGLDLYLAIGQRPASSPWLTVTNAGQVIVRTAQTRLYLQARIAAPATLSPLTGGSLVTLPVYVELASAQARLLDIACPAASSPGGFDLSVSPSLGTLAIAQADPSTMANFQVPTTLSSATILNALLFKVSAYGRIDLGGGPASWTTVNFTAPDIAAGTVKSVSTPDIARASVASLLGSTTLSVQGPGGGLATGPATLAPALQALLTGVAPSLDAIIGAVEAASGARLGGADVRADGVRCRGAALMA